MIAYKLKINGTLSYIVTSSKSMSWKTFTISLCANFRSQIVLKSKEIMGIIKEIVGIIKGIVGIIKGIVRKSNGIY